MRFPTYLACFVLLGLLGNTTVLGQPPKELEPEKIRRCIDVLRTSADKSEREQAVRALANIGAPAVAPLSQLLRDASSKTRKDTAWAFRGMEKAVLEKAVPMLIDAMKREKDVGVLESLAKAIARSKEAGVPGLIDVVRTTTGDTRQLAFYSLGRMRASAKAATPTLITFLDDKHDDVRNGAAYVLGRIGTDAKSAVPALFGLAKRSRKDLRYAIDALSGIGVCNQEVLAIVLKSLTHSDPMLRSSAVDACAAFGPKAKAAVPDLIRLLDDQKVNQGTWPRPVVFALGRIGPAAKAARPKLLVELKDPDVEHAMHAAGALLRIGVEQKKAVAVFGRALFEKQKPEVRFRTLEVLMQMGPAAKPVAPLLRQIVKDETSDEYLRSSAEEILRQIDRKGEVD